LRGRELQPALPNQHPAAWGQTEPVLLKAVSLRGDQADGWYAKNFQQETAIMLHDPKH
jgi:hypothetical protein